jgi:hypothetical protein
MSGERDIVHPPHLQAGKAAAKALVRAAGGGEAAENFCSKSQPRLSAYGLPNTADFMPVDVVRDLEAITHGAAGHPLVTHWLANEAGYLLVRKPRRGGGGGDLHAELACVSKETHDVVQKLIEALRDGVVTAREIAELGIRQEIAEAQEQLATLDAILAQIEAEGR